ncbi:YceI family protein [Thermomonas sp.]
MYKRLLLTSFITAAMAVASLSAAAAGIPYKLDPDHTNVIASWSHFGYSHPSANFGAAAGSVVYDAANPEKSSVEVRLPLSGLDTFVPALDEHLKAADFFDVAKFPVATFKSSKVEALGKGRFKVMGTLTIKGISKPVTLDAKLNNVGIHPMTKQESIGFDATATIKRSDFGLGMYAPAVSDEVTLRITTEGAVADKASKSSARP